MVSPHILPIVWNVSMFHLLNGRSPMLIHPLNLDLSGPMVFTYAYHLFRFTVVPSVNIGPVLTTLVASKGEEQKNRALSSPKGISVGA